MAIDRAFSNDQLQVPRRRPLDLALSRGCTPNLLDRPSLGLSSLIGLIHLVALGHCVVIIEHHDLLGYPSREIRSSQIVSHGCSRSLFVDSRRSTPLGSVFDVHDSEIDAEARFSRCIRYARMP